MGKHPNLGGDGNSALTSLKKLHRETILPCFYILLLVHEDKMIRGG